MSGIEYDKLLQPVSSTEPSGKNTEYDPAFQDLLHAATGEPERSMGDSTVPRVEPDWNLAVSLAVDLLLRTKDVRIAVVLSNALLRTEGFAGLARGLTLTLRLLTDFWDNIHPQLDPEDNNDPTARVNALLNLCGLEAFLNPVRATPLVTSRVFGAVSLRDIEISEGKAPTPAPAEKPPLDPASINAAFQDCEIEQLRETATAVAGILGSIRKIEAFVTDKVSAVQAPDLSPIANLFARIDTLLSKYLAERTEGTEGTEGTDQESPIAPGDAEPVQADANPGEKAINTQPMTGKISNREDVIRTLDRLCDYYVRNEPSSPVPLLLRRAQRLATKDFIDIVRDLAPEALAKIEAIRGAEGDS